MRRRTFLIAALLAVAVSAPEASAQQAPLASEAPALETTRDAAAPMVRVTGLSPALVPAVQGSASSDESARWESATAEMSAAGSRAQFKLWCLALFLGGAGVYWAGDQAGVDFVASTGAFVAVVGLLGLIMPTW